MKSLFTSRSLRGKRPCSGIWLVATLRWHSCWSQFLNDKRQRTYFTDLIDRLSHGIRATVGLCIKFIHKQSFDYSTSLEAAKPCYFCRTIFLPPSAPLLFAYIAVLSHGIDRLYTGTSTSLYQRTSTLAHEISVLLPTAHYRKPQLRILCPVRNILRSFQKLSHPYKQIKLQWTPQQRATPSLSRSVAGSYFSPLLCF